MFQMMGIFAEFERSMIREQVLAGMSRAAASGTHSGQIRAECRLSRRGNALNRPGRHAELHRDLAHAQVGGTVSPTIRAVEALSLFPKVPEPIRGQLGISDRMLNVLVSEVVLQSPGVVAVVGELVAAGMA
jgi:hypothetical protein